MENQVINVSAHFNDVEKLRVDDHEDYVVVAMDHVTLFFYGLEEAYKFAKTLLTNLDNIEGRRDARELGY